MGNGPVFSPLPTREKTGQYIKKSYKNEKQAANRTRRLRLCAILWLLNALFLREDLFDAAHVGAQGGGDVDAAVGVEIIFQKRN